MKYLIIQLVLSTLYQWASVIGLKLDEDFRYYNVGVLMASNLNYPFDLERCGPAVDMALEEINERFLAQHKIKLLKVQKRFH
ncbi:uncharacterized protein LOC143201542 [Rhynchophorus ferrugineus]|uniref:uncharacterized protein LOC143201542 n=1 Tax=Rhynchophorus ferrugineus TaxID=354439 RepID=UPI003FCDB55D